MSMEKGRYISESDIVGMMAARVPGWLERVVMPLINELKGELKATSARFEGEFKSIHSEIQGVDGKVESAEKRLETKIDALDRRIETKIDALDKRMDVAQRVAVIEEKIKGFEVEK